MQLHQIKPLHKEKKKKRIGRGGKRGTYSGRGMKGQKSRSGHRFQPVIKELIKRYPKLRGYKFRSKSKTNKTNSIVLNLATLEKKFSAEEKITPAILLEKRIIRKIKSKIDRIPYCQCEALLQGRTFPATSSIQLQFFAEPLLKCDFLSIINSKASLKLTRFHDAMY